MSDSREAFEGHCARIGFVLKPDGGGDYLPGNGQELWSIWCASWQAARAGQAASEPVAEVAQVGGTPVVFWDKSLTVGTKLYTHPASRQAVSVPEWIKCSERMPTVNDADFDGYVWWARFNHVARTKQRIVVDGLEHLDDAFWMPTNLTLTQPQPPKQEQSQ